MEQTRKRKSRKKPKTADADAQVLCDAQPSHTDIADRAYCIWLMNGQHPGGEIENWNQAQTQLQCELQAQHNGDSK